MSVLCPWHIQVFILLPTASFYTSLPLSLPLSNDSGGGGVPLCVASASGPVGLSDVAEGNGKADRWLHLPGDRVCVRLLPLHLHPHFGKSRLAADCRCLSYMGATVAECLRLITAAAR